MTSRQILQLLQSYESRNLTCIEPDGSWPIIWQRARGVHVWDVEGKKYVDLTAAFGVAAAGHANRAVVRAGQKQMDTLLHAMGDVHPHARKAQLARELSRITFEKWTAVARPRSKAQPSRRAGGPGTAKTIFCNSGFEAVEAALKTSKLATGRPGIIAFLGGYHGLGYGALNATHRAHFRAPFRDQLREFGYFVPFPKRSAKGPSLSDVREKIRRLFSREKIGAILVEPIQVRGGIQIPPDDFLPLMRELCDRHGALLVVDEIYTGFGRTGRWFACEHAAVVPDIVCLGKALTGGFPLSACVGKAQVMDAAWPPSTGEAIHTSTFLGHPVGCAMALAQIKEIAERNLPERSAKLGRILLDALERETDGLLAEVRGQGLLAGVELRSSNGSPATSAALSLIKQMLQMGFILLPEGEHGNVVSFTPPLTITEAQIQSAARALGRLLTRSGRDLKPRAR